MRDLVGQVLGRLGAPDPATTAVDLAHRKPNELDDLRLCKEIIEKYLVKTLRAAPKPSAQDALGYATQELLRYIYKLQHEADAGTAELPTEFPETLRVIFQPSVCYCETHVIPLLIAMPDCHYNRAILEYTLWRPPSRAAFACKWLFLSVSLPLLLLQISLYLPSPMGKVSGVSNL